MTTQISVVSAHGGNGTTGLSQWHGIVVILVGIASLSTFILLKRMNRISPRATVYGIFFGIMITAIGGILFEGLAPDPTFTAKSMPFARLWYQPLAIGTGISIMVLSFIAGVVRWPTRPRYTFLGILMGGWVLYPYLFPGFLGYTNPIGYGLVIGTPVLVGYILWKDTGSVLYRILQDPVARRFGVGVGAIMSLFFMSTTGYMSFFLEEGAPQETTIVVMSVLYQLVKWPTIEAVFPEIPFFIAISPGVIILVGLLGVLIGLNAAVIARYWLVEQQAGTTQGTAGTAAVVGACTCGCCGPLVSQIAFIAAGPAIAAPLYWIFVDSASPLSSLFSIGSIVLFTGTLIYSIDSARLSTQSTSVAPAD
ncbi:hypothetical protein [Natronomonas salsuginis]|uniref:Uncharacterized protein n=1 Tax=Natronomonas salsuginis TaxID=2217661 RepID=A0A4U5JB61_9EURY|nr:hypothetical protein [Natronomonas salsuginis]TKR25068.1 hypothetical protein DM868_11965 [Natronomonas salsuginis]